MLKTIKPYFQLALAMAIIGTSVVAGKLMTKELPVMFASALRFGIASLMLLTLGFFTNSFKTRPHKIHLLIIFLQAFTGIFLFSFFLLYGLQNTQSIEAGLILGTLPGVTAILALFILNEKIEGIQIFGIICAVIGASLLHMSGYNASSSSSAFIGYVLILAAVICEALFAVLGKLVANNLSAIEMATYVSILGFIFFAPFALWDAFHFDFTKTSYQAWLLTLYFGLVVTVGAFWLFYNSLSHISVSIAGSFMALIPISAMISSSLVLGETAQSIHLLAGCFILFGIFLSCKTSVRNQSLIDSSNAK